MSLELNAADAQMGEVYRTALGSFPIRGFVLATQRRFLAFYAHCDERYQQACAALLTQRIAVLGSMVNPVAVYSSQYLPRTFDPDDGVFWIASRGGSLTLHYFGGFMPDANAPEPFPSGFVCDDEMPLQRTAFGYAGAGSSDEVIVTDTKIVSQISCSPRNSLFGEYQRLR